MTVYTLPLERSAFWEVIPSRSGSGVVRSISHPGVLCVCVCPGAALMIVGNLTCAIVILMELHGEDYHFTAGEKRRQKTLGGQMLREKTVKTSS